jgi:integrase
MRHAPHESMRSCHIVGGSTSSISEIELQRFLNEHVAAGASRSKLAKLLLYLRSILDHAVMKKIIVANLARNPGYRLKAKSRKAISERYLTMEECQRLLSAVVGADHLAFRILIQLGLRSEELFALRRDDVIGDMLRIDEAIVEGASAIVKTEASEASVFVPPDLRSEMRGWLKCLGPDPRAWLFPSPKGRPWGSQNYLNRVLKPAAIRARVGIFTRRTPQGEEVESADPSVALRHYQKSIPASVRAAALALETELIGKNRQTIRSGCEQARN